MNSFLCFSVLIMSLLDLLMLIVKIYFMSSGVENQRVKVRVAIKKITMNIKFPCSLTVQIKHDSTVDCKKMYELKSGECIINETVQSEMEAPYSAGKLRYEDKKVMLNIFMVSMSGKVASGSASFSTYGKEPGHSTDCVQYLEKCPDKQAKIYYSVELQVMRRHQRLDKSYHSQAQQIKKRTTYNSVTIPHTVRTPLTANKQKQPWKTNRSPSPVHNHQMNESIVDGVAILDRKSARHDDDRSAKKYSFMDHTKMKTQQHDQSFQGRQKVHESFSNKTLELHTFTPKDRYLTQVGEDEEKEEEIQRLRSRVRNLEQHDKGNVQAIRDTREEAERRRNRVQQLEGNKFELEENLRLKEGKIKRLEKQLKETSELMEQVQNQLKTIKTHTDLKEHSSKQQLRKIQQKYKKSELQREQITEQYNRSLKTFQEGQRKYQTMLKDKERTSNEERGRMHKTIDQQTSSYQFLESNNKTLKQRLEELLGEKKHAMEALASCEAHLEESRTEVGVLSARLKVESEKVRQLQEEMEVFKDSEIQKQHIRKKLNESIVSGASLSQKVQNNLKNIQCLQQRVKQLEEEVRRKGSEKAHLATQLSELRKKYDNLKMHDEQQSKQIQSMALLNSTANSKIADFKSKWETQRRNLDQTSREFSNRCSWLTKERDGLQGEVDELRWELEKHTGSLEELSVQLRSQHDEVFRLNEQILDKNQKIKRLDEAHAQLVSSYDHLNSSNAQNEKKKREIQTIAKEQQKQLGQLRKKTHHLEREFQDLTHRLRLSETTTKQRTIEAQKKIREKQDNLQSKGFLVQTLEVQLRQSQDEATLTKQSLQSTQLELNHLRQALASMRRDFQGQQTLAISLKQGDVQNKRLLIEKDNQLQRKKAQIEKSLKGMDKLKEQASNFRISCNSSLQIFFNDLIREEDHPSTTTQPLRNRNSMYPEQKIANLQVEYMQKHGQISSAQRVKTAKLVQQKDLLEYELERIKRTIQEVEKSRELDVKHERQRCKELYEQIAKMQEQDKIRQQRQQELISSKERHLQHAKCEMAKHEEENSELQSQLEMILSQFEGIKDENRQLEERLLVIRSQQMKQRVQWQGKSHQTVSRFQEQQQQLKQSLHQYEEKINHLQKDLLDKVQIIKRQENELNILTYENDKREDKINSLINKLQEAQGKEKELEKSIREKDRDIKKAAQAIDHYSAKWRQEKERLEESMFKSQEQSHLIVELNIQIERWREEVRVQQERFTSGESSHRHRFDLMRVSNDKLAQELKEMKEVNISLSSQFQLTKFMVTQLQKASQDQREVQKELRNEIDKRKHQTQQLNQELTSSQFANRQLQQQAMTINQQKDSLTGTVDRLKQAIQQMRMNAQDDKRYSEQVGQLQSQIERIRSQKGQIEDHYERSLLEMKNALREVKRESSGKIARQEDLKRKLKAAQRLLQNTHPDLAMERSRLLKESDRQKRDIMSRSDSLENKTGQLQDELNALKQKIRRQGDRTSQEAQALKQEMTAKDFIIRNQQIQMDNLASKMPELMNERARMQSRLEEQRSKCKRIEEQLENESKNGTRKQREHQEGMKGLLSELSRRVEGARSRRLQGSFNEVERMLVEGSYREFETMVTSLGRQKIMI